MSDVSPVVPTVLVPANVPWYKSHSVQAMIVLTVLAILPLFPVLFQDLGLSQQSAKVGTAVISFAVGVFGVISRIWFLQGQIAG